VKEEDDLVAPQTIRAVEGLVEAVPELREDWEEHLALNHTPLPYLFFADVKRYAIDELRRADPELRRRFAIAINRLSDAWARAQPSGQAARVPQPE